MNDLFLSDLIFALILITIWSLKCCARILQSSLMSDQSPIDQIAERVERLLLRYEELNRTNALLYKEIETLTHDRDSLKSRLSAARARVDALLARLPEAGAPPSSAPRGSE